MKLALTALLVRDYDEAVAFYCDALGFRLIEDSDLGGGKRWVVISGDDGGALLLAKARKPGKWPRSATSSAAGSACSPRHTTSKPYRPG